MPSPAILRDIIGPQLSFSTSYTLFNSTYDQPNTIAWFLVCLFSLFLFFIVCFSPLEYQFHEDRHFCLFKYCFLQSLGPRTVSGSKEVLSKYLVSKCSVMCAWVSLVRRYEVGEMAAFTYSSPTCFSRGPGPALMFLLPIYLFPPAKSEIKTPATKINIWRWLEESSGWIGGYLIFNKTYWRDAGNVKESLAGNIVRWVYPWDGFGGKKNKTKKPKAKCIKK